MTRLTRLEICALATFVVVFAAVSVHSRAGKSATFDEPVHLLAGYAALTQGDYRVDPTHPPAVRMWAALPLLVVDQPAVGLEQIDAMRGRDWLQRTTTFSQRFMFTQNDGDRLLSAARSMVMLVGLALGLVLFGWARQWLGRAAAIWVLTFYALTPTVLAHSSLVTTDMGVTACIFAAIYGLWRLQYRFSPMWVVATGLATGCALATKFSGLMLGPMLLALLIGSAASARSPLTWRQAGVAAGGIATVAIVILWAAYGFRYAPSATDTWVFHVDRLPSVQQYFGGWLRVAQWVDAYHLLPNAFTHGLLFSQASAAQLPGYLAGEYSQTGWWYYFPLAFLIKTPLPLLVLVTGGLVTMARWGRPLGLVNVAFVVVPIAVILGLAMATGINIGVRHILPMYPFVVLVAGVVAARMMRARLQLPRVALAVLVAYWCVQVGRVHPDHLAYFNRLIGGPEHGGEYLTDSNLDWGQDLRPLKDWMDAHGVEHINLAYFGTADPAYYGMHWTPLPGSGLGAGPGPGPVLPGYVAISATVQSGVYLPRRWRLFYRGFRRQAPVAVIGRSIRVYKIDSWPEPPMPAEWTDTRLAATRGLAESLFAWGWHDQAIRQFERYLDQRPADIPALAGLSQALIARGRLGEAIARVERTRLRMPEHPAVHDLYGRLLAAQGRLADAVRAFQRSSALDPAWQAPRDALKTLSRADAGGGAPPTP